MIHEFVSLTQGIQLLPAKLSYLNLVQVSFKLLFDHT